MKRMRFSISRLMGFVLVAGLGFGGLKGANNAWASVCYTLMVLGLVLAILAALQSQGKGRAYWAGFAIAGWAYFLLLFSPMVASKVTSPPLLTEILFDQLEPLIHPEAHNFTATLFYAPTPIAAPPPLLPPVSAASAVAGPSPSPAPAALSYAVSLTTTPLSFLTMPPTNMVRVHYSQVAHSLTALLMGMLGGLCSLWLVARRERQRAELPLVEGEESGP